MKRPFNMSIFHHFKGLLLKPTRQIFFGGGGESSALCYLTGRIYTAIFRGIKQKQKKCLQLKVS